jgi:hypothetical protein
MAWSASDRRVLDGVAFLGGTILMADQVLKVANKKGKPLLLAEWREE